MNQTLPNGKDSKVKQYSYIETTATILALHTFAGGLDYLFHYRRGHEWNERFVDYHDKLWRTQVGQTYIAEYMTTGDCRSNCSIMMRGSDQTWYGYVWGTRRLREQLHL